MSLFVQHSVSKPLSVVIHTCSVGYMTSAGIPGAQPTHPATRIPEAQLAELRGLSVFGRLEPFPDPHVIAASKRALTQRGENWAAAVLGRDLSRRSIAFPRLPYLESGEQYVLAEADRIEEEP